MNISIILLLSKQTNALIKNLASIADGCPVFTNLLIPHILLHNSCQEQHTTQSSNRICIYVSIEGALFYVRHKDTEKELNVKVVRGAEEAERIFKEFHASKAGGHSGRKITIDSVSNRYYWPGMTVDIEKWVSFLDVLSHLIFSATVSYNKQV